jgi:hypothetical protein
VKYLKDDLNLYPYVDTDAASEVPDSSSNFRRVSSLPRKEFPTDLQPFFRARWICKAISQRDIARSCERYVELSIVVLYLVQGSAFANVFFFYPTCITAKAEAHR